MAVEVIGKLKQKNNGSFKIADAQDISYDGNDAVSLKEKLDSMIQIGGEESNADIWIDVNDENISELITPDIVEEMRNTLVNINGILNALKSGIDAGYFNDIEPGSEPPHIVGSPAGSVLLKRGLKEILPTTFLKPAELGFCLDTRELYIGLNGGGKGLLATVPSPLDDDPSSGGTGNVTADYVELISPSGTRYRITVDEDGNLKVLNSRVDTSAKPIPKDAGSYSGLMINKVYAAGGVTQNTVPVSHDFIEIYNNSTNTVNLNGLALHYGENLAPWQSLPLRGEIKPSSSFLIRCANHADLHRRTTRFKIEDFDMSWNIPLSKNGYKLYLNIPKEIIGDNVTQPKVNPFNIDGAGTKEEGYIDLFAAGGIDIGKIIDGYAGNFSHLVNEYRIVKRRYSEALSSNFANTGNNSDDLEFIDVREADVSIYSPRSTKFGMWDFYYDQRQFVDTKPNVLFMGFGQNGDTDRTFTWQSKLTDRGELRYRRKEDTEWTVIESDRKFLSLPDVDVTVHSVIVRGLTPGDYVYKAGEEGYWSNEEQFTVLDAAAPGARTKILWTSDQQSWSEFEYSAWAKVAKHIGKTEEFDFMINTGDVSQNANRTFEWRSYYESAVPFFRGKPHMTCVGNNDLVDKADPIAYTYYSTVENSPYASVYSFNYGLCHFIGINSNTPAGNATIAQQIAFIREDMDFTKNPQNEKRWTILYMHESPYTIIRKANMWDYIDAFYEVGIDLVLCGHHHCYTRSRKMGPLVRTLDGNGKTTSVKDTVLPNDPAVKGTYYFMMQATGFKLSGKTVPTSNELAVWRAYYDKPGDPCYGMLDITHESITISPKRVVNVVPLLDNINKEAATLPFDEVFVITKQ